jgi:hypothetical protein
MAHARSDEEALPLRKEILDSVSIDILEGKVREGKVREGQTVRGDVKDDSLEFQEK